MDLRFQCLGNRIVYIRSRIKAYGCIMRLIEKNLIVRYGHDDLIIDKQEKRMTIVMCSVIETIDMFDQ
jgi:hypothetical protein